MSSNRPGLSRTLQHLDEILGWDPWVAAPLPGELVSDPVAAVEEALTAARPARDGGAYVRTFADASRREASSQAAAGDRRPLAGVTLAVKDLMAVAGHPMGAGSEQRDGARPEDGDAAVLALLRGCGAIPIGQTALNEFAYGVTGLNEHTGSPHHPSDPTLVPGGSSSGSALAVATGGARLGLGTDTGGSVRIPAALCGVVGFKPRYGEYPMQGVHPLAPSLDHLGLLARGVSEIRRAHAAMGHDPGVRRLPDRVGVVEAELEAADVNVRSAVRAALDVLAGAGARVEAVVWPSSDESFAISTAIMFAEAAAIHLQALKAHPERFSADVRGRLEAGRRIGAPTYVAAKAAQLRVQRQVDAVLDGVDVVITPTVPVVAPHLDGGRDGDLSALLVQSTRLLNVVGMPALSLPASTAGLPVGLQLVASSSARLLGFADAVADLLTG